MSSDGKSLLGSDYLSSIPKTPAGIEDLTPSMCFNLTRFKEMLRQFRALDDSVLIRMNRSHALNRTRDPNYARFDNAECASLWSDLVENWRGREKIIRFCVDTADLRSAMAQATQAVADAAAEARMDEPFAREVLRNQIHNELAVETIIRRRTLAAFFNRCAAYTPPKDTIPTEDLSQLPPPTRERLL